MRSGRKYLECLLAIAVLCACANSPGRSGKIGVLVVAHGDRQDGWNRGVRQAIAPLRDRYVLELAFLFPVPGESLQEGFDRLDARGVDTILVIPLLVSSHSEHFEELEYVLGLRKTVSSITEEYEPVDVKAAILMGRSIDSSPTVAKILARQAKEISLDAQQETLVLVGHGPNSEGYNQEWLRHMNAMGRTIQQQLPFRRLHSLTLRDDAPAHIREAASRALRSTIEQESMYGDVLVVTLLVSHGETQSGIRERLKGLVYRIADQGLVADPLITQWVEEEIQRLMTQHSKVKR